MKKIVYAFAALTVLFITGCSLPITVNDSTRGTDEKMKLVNKGIEYFEQGKLDRAIDYFSKAIKVDQNDAIAFYYRGLSRFIKGQTDQATLDAQKVIDLKPGDSAGYSLFNVINSKAELYFWNKNYREAVDEFSQIITCCEESNRNSLCSESYLKYVHYKKGEALEKLGEVDRAFLEYKIFVGRFEDLINLLSLNDDAKLVGIAKRLYSYEIKKNPIKVENYLYNGVLHYIDDQIEIAIENFSKGINLMKDGKWSILYYRRANAYFEAGKYILAIKDYTRYLELVPNATSTYGKRAKAYYQSVQMENALEDLNKAIKIFPNHGEYYDLRAEIYKLKGDLERANADFIKARKLIKRELE